MRINELKIHGFKSFANKTSIKFDDNFVGIVGPNGSGKSNIIDAIRWVFGEQSSKNLRGDNSSDVIFGGTQSRKAMNQAEVTLVLDNKDQYLPLEYNEVMLTRRLYRSGESEFLINNVKCRLKDITDLIMDSGMGKNSFSIISQGKIEEIVMSKPDKRRTVVEDVAGILKYKKRKETALRKIAKTDDNISQVDLILGEMELRLTPLKRQREAALKYLEFKETLEVYEVSLLANRINQNREKYEALELIIKNKREEEVLINSKINNSDQEIYIINEDLNDKNNQLHKLNIQLELIKTELNQLESQFLILQERKNHTSTNSNDQRIATLNSLLIEKERTNTQINQNRVQINEEFNIISTKLQSLESELSVLRAERYSLTDEIELKKQQVSSQNIPYAVRTVCSAFKEAKIIRNLFTTDTKFTTAIAISLGGRINEIILNDTNEVKQAISLLNTKKAGRATFIPLNSVKNYQVDERLKNTISGAKGFIDYAINLVDFEEKYYPAFNNLLSTTLIVDTIENANQLAKSIYNRYRIITLTGELVSTTGTISGGQNNKQNSLLVQSEIENKEKQLEKVSSRYKTLTAEVQNLETEYHSSRSEKDRIEQRFKDITDEIKNINYEISDLKANSETDYKEDNTINDKLASLRQNVHNLSEQKELLNRDIASLNDEKDKISFEIRDLNEQSKQLNKTSVEDTSEYTRLEIHLSDDINILSQEYNMSFDLAFKNAQKEIDLDEYSKEVKSLKQKIKSLGIVNTNAIAEYEEIKERYDFIYEQKEDSVNAKNKLLEIIDNLDQVVITQFEETFYKLQAEFKMIFTELFGGGYADLILTDENDLLNTGVEIVAQPPGKKLQTISLLSGGEKALTAIALLFAILRIRTVPFAILDEVEAALDEANVKRYAKYLSVFSENTQFLVITHRQGTMETVDELYGITMMEKGVSSVVNVKLNEEEGNV